MYRRLLYAFVPGFISSLLAGLLLNFWTTLSIAAQVLIALAIGIAAIVFVVIISRRVRTSGTRAASGIRSQGNVRVKGVEVEDAQGGDVEVASNISAKKGNVEISDIKVKKGTDQDAGNSG